MNNTLKIQKIEFANGRHKAAADEMNKVQTDFKKETVLFCEKIAFYSAGIVSLSITAVGFLSDKIRLVDYFLFLPIYGFLYTGWLLLFLSFYFGLLARRQDSIHMFYAVELEWRKSRRKLNNLNGHKSCLMTLKNITKVSRSEKKFLKDVKFVKDYLPIIFILGLGAIVFFGIGCVDQIIKIN